MQEEKKNWEVYIDGELYRTYEDISEAKIEKLVKTLSTLKTVPELNIPNPYYGKNITYKETDEFDEEHYRPYPGCPGK